MVLGGDYQTEPRLLCTMSDSRAATGERSTALLSRKVLTIDLVGRLGVFLEKSCYAVDLKFGLHL